MTTTRSPTITITVSGPTGSGKSRVLALIAEALKLIHGDKVIIDSPELESEKRISNADYTHWHSPRSGTVFKLEEVSLPDIPPRIALRRKSVMEGYHGLGEWDDTQVWVEPGYKPELRVSLASAYVGYLQRDREGFWVPLFHPDGPALGWIKFSPTNKIHGQFHFSATEFRLATEPAPKMGDLVREGIHWPVPDDKISETETSQTGSKAEQSEPVKRDSGTRTHHSCRSRGGLCASSADRTTPVSLSVSDENDLLARIEARLTEEVRRLADALGCFSRNTQRISHELPDTSHFGKSVTLFLSLGSLQLANALLKNEDKPLLLNDGIEYLRELGLSLDDFIREIELDGRKFLAIALVDNHADQPFN
ncbi:hypothetical protein MMC72_001620 [Salmonella enterica]|nr:hypothetical protein [Salmonella enterica]